MATSTRCGGSDSGDARRAIAPSKKKRAAPQNLILSGFMGCGKSTVGRILADRLGWRFVDLDRVIERSSGYSVAEIFRKRGEGGFRRAETQAIRGLPRVKDCVIAIGGGAPLLASNRLWLKRAGHLVYIKVPPAELVRRLARGAGRPLLSIARGNRRKLGLLVGDLLRRRESHYMKADTCVAAGSRSARAVAGLILRKMSRRQKGKTDDGL